jgi:hypothetical protein
VLLKEGYSKVLCALRVICSRWRGTFFLEALSPEEVKTQLNAVGLKEDWIFADFDETLIEQSSQHLWARAIIKKKKAAVPPILLKYIRYYRWNENLFELNKMFRHSDGLEELRDGVIPRLSLNENALRILNRLKEKKIKDAGIFRKMAYRFFPLTTNLVIISSNCGVVIKLFLDRENIRSRLKENKIRMRAVVANRMGFDEKGNVNGLDHRENIIDVHTKKDYIPNNNTVLADERDRNLKHTHPR